MVLIVKMLWIIVRTIHVSTTDSVRTATTDQFVIVAVCIRLYFMLSFLAYLSRRLTGELIVYPCSGVRRRPSFTITKIFSSETAWPIKAKLHVEHPYRKGERKFI